MENRNVILLRVPQRAGHMARAGGQLAWPVRAGGVEVCACCCEDSGGPTRESCRKEAGEGKRGPHGHHNTYFRGHPLRNPLDSRK